MTPRTLVRKTLSDGTAVMMAGTLLAGVLTYGWQASATRALGEEHFAPVASVWTIMFLIVTILLAPVEQYAIRTVASGPTGRAQLAHALPRIGVLAVAATALVAALCWLLRDSLFDGVAGYVPVCAAIVLSFGQLALIRGVLAGQREFAAYGYITGLDSIARLALSIPLFFFGAAALAYAWMIPLCALTALFWMHHRPRRAEAVPLEEPPAVPVGRFIAHTVGGTVAAQMVLASGPLVLSVLGATGAAVTTFFATQTAFRAAFMVATPGWSRALPALTSIATRHDFARLGRLARRLMVLTALGAAVGGAAAAVVAPPLLALFYGSGVRPTAFVAATCAAGTIVAIGNLGLTQILVAGVRTRRITTVWWVALAGGVVVLAVVGGSPTTRVCVSFLTSEVIALMGLTYAASTVRLRAHERAALAVASAGATALPAEEDPAAVGVPLGR